MKTVIVLASALTLAACNQAANAPTKASAANDTAGMEMSAAAKTGSGSGKITELDKAGGKIAIAHGPIPALNWPAMTMGFNADPKILDGIAVGDQVDFDLTLKGNEAMVTALMKR